MLGGESIPNQLRQLRQSRHVSGLKGVGNTCGRVGFDEFIYVTTLLKGDDVVLFVYFNIKEVRNWPFVFNIPAVLPRSPRSPRATHQDKADAKTSKVPVLDAGTVLPPPG